MITVIDEIKGNPLQIDLIEKINQIIREINSIRNEMQYKENAYDD